MSRDDVFHEKPSKDSVNAFRESIFESFSEVRDPRILSSAIRHELPHILFITLCAVLCGANKLKEVAVYTKEREDWLKSVLNLACGLPSYSTFWLTFSMLSPSEFQKGFSKWITHLVELTADEVYAIDRKALRGTAIKGQLNSYIHLVSL